MFFRSQVLYLAVKTLIEYGHEHVYDAVEKPLQLAQSAAFLEVHFFYRTQSTFSCVDVAL